MKKSGFRDWLVVSDIDGTFNSLYRTTPERNLIAVRDFLGKGGHFTLASGRNLESALRIYSRIGQAKTPLIFLNGAGIYDVAEKKLLSFTALDEAGTACVFHTAQNFPKAELVVFSDALVYPVKPRLFGYSYKFPYRLQHQMCASLFEVPRGLWGKATFFSEPAVTVEIMAYIRGTFPTVKAVRTSPYTIELMNASVDKGAALCTLSGLLGIDRAQTAAIGDYDNDLSMLAAAAFSACSGQAPARVKAACLYCACHANKGAVADVLEYLTKFYIN